MRSSDISELIAFAAVAEQKSFRRAADKLGLTPSTLSHALRALEARLGLRLLNRTTRSVALTDAGAALLAQIAPALQQIAGAVEGLHALSPEARGTVKVNTPRLVGGMVFGQRLGEFARAYPGVVLDIAVNDNFVDIVGEGFDAGIRLGESIAQDMVAVRVTPDLRVIVVGAPSYLAAHPAAIETPADLRAHACIGYRMGASRTLCDWDLENGSARFSLAPKGALAVDGYELLLDAALAGAGLAYIVESSARAAIADGRLVQLLPAWSAPLPGFYLYYPSGRHMSSALRAVIDFFRYRPA